MSTRSGFCILCLCAVLALGGTAFASPHFRIGSETEWHDAMSAGRIQAMTSSQWDDYMIQWGTHLKEGDAYPANEFLPPTLYVSPGGSAGYPSDAGLVMVWQPGRPGSYSSAWRYDYGPDPDLNNCTINITVTPPQFDLSGNQINVVSFGIQDVNGFIRAWYWNCGPGGLPWNAPTTITINTALVGVGAANPVANSYASNPFFNLANSQSFIVDENVQWVGGPMPVPPPPATFPGIWNYWHNLIVTPNIPPKGADPTKWSQPVVEYTPGLNPPLFLGWDERSTYYQRPICADDWLCTDRRPVTDIHWWGSFLNWTQPDPPALPTAFHIGIWTDVPAGSVPFSHPGTLVRQIWCTNYSWNFAGYDYDPRDGSTDEACFQFNQWLKPDEYFYQDPGPTGQNIYWVSISAVYTATPQYPWGWKTRPHYFQDDAVRITAVTPAWPPVVGSTWANGTPIQYPTGTTWDLAFELTTKEEQWEYDWGDAPDPTYPTLAASVPPGASHMIVPGFCLGALEDAETDGQPNANATGDDLAVSDDEDGIKWPPALIPGSVVAIEVTVTDTVGAGGYFDLWIDYNRDGDWDDAGEQVFTTAVVWAGVNTFSILVPPGLSEGCTFARARLSHTIGLPYSGPAADGEVEDYEVSIACEKWVQKPDLSSLGIDVEASEPYILADDWECTEPGPVTDIHVWGSWLNDILPNGNPHQVAFTLSIHEDIPADPAGGYSTPGRVLWTRTFQPGEFQVYTEREDLFEGWMTPPDNYWAPADTVCWRYDFCLDQKEFCQTGTAQNPKIYWLDVQARPMSTDARFGWKTSEQHWNDDAVWVQGAEPYTGWWGELRYPYNHELRGQSIDLAFEITGCCPEKYTQPPDTTTSGFDVNATYPYLLADDFPCTTTGPISGITVWGSWLYDILPNGDAGSATFTVSIYDDNPAVLQGYSQPRTPLWSRTYLPGEYKVKQYQADLQEGWLTPPQQYVSPADTIAWQYHFPLQRGEFTQEGSVADPKVYWVGVQALIGGAGSSCTAPDNGHGTVDLPALHCQLVTPNDDMRIRDGLPVNTTIEIDAVQTNFTCNTVNNVCSFQPGSDCREPGGSLGGEKECFECTLAMPMVGTGALSEFSRAVDLPLHFEVHTGPRNPGDAVQSFDTDMFRMFGQIIGDPDFDLLRVTAGTDFGMPSPGHTTLTKLPDGNWNVDSFFDITYRIDFVGAPGGALAGRSGSTTGTIRFQIPTENTTVAKFGWKTSQTHWNDDAVWGQGPAPTPTSIWYELLYPPEHPQAGQSCDLAFQVQTDCPCQELDWGDAPDPTYPTLAVNAGANHVIVPGFFLGALIDAEGDGQPNANATGDDLNTSDDEDGIQWPPALAPGSTPTIAVTASAAGFFDLWIDYNRDGDWADPGEQVFASVGLAAGVNYLTFVVPSGLTEGCTFARARFSSTAGLSYTGPASDGEVEDYEVSIACEKWLQQPDLEYTGIDVHATEPFILADDWQCTEPGPVTDIHVWGSWMSDILPNGNPHQVAFTLSIHRDIPADPLGGYSRPGEVLWTRTYQPGEFQVQAARRDLLEGWMIPPDSYWFPADTVCWRYDFCLDPKEFCQVGTQEKPVVYWLDVQARPTSADAQFGWKTSLDHWNDDAVWGQGAEPYTGPWGELRYPSNHQLSGQSIDLAFAITGCCPEKYTQPPDTTTNGMDVNATYPYLLADDFPCDETGPISGITVWGSWKYDRLPVGGAGNVTFAVSLYDDNPTGTQGYSQPRTPLWTRTYGPGLFQVKQYQTGLQEGWLTPPQQYQFPGDSIIWQYHFPLRQGEFTQQGSATQRQVYWVGVQAQVQSADAQFGWKSSQVHWNDDAVWGQGPAPWPTSIWYELRYPPGHQQYPESCDLAFRIDTDCPCQQIDWGDAPDPTYPTLAASAGASHVIVPGFFLGALIDAEADGQPTVPADGDDLAGVDDEDGVTFPTPLIASLAGSVTVTASAAGMLDAWIDFNGDGDWADAGEQIAASFPLVAGANVVGFMVPPGAGTPGAVLDTYSRFRFSTAGGLTYTGPAPDGEVEDYVVKIYPKPVIVDKAKAKCLQIGAYVLIRKDIVTANFGSAWYFEEPLRYAALGVLPPVGVGMSPWSPGNMVSCYGYTTMSGCELMLQEVYSWLEGDGNVRPLGQNNRDSGGGAFCNQPGLTNNAGTPSVSAVGLNTVAELVTLWGRCTCILEAGGTQTGFFINDGSDLWDGSVCAAGEPALGVRVYLPTGAQNIRKGRYYAVTGIMRTYTNTAGQCVRWLWPRTDADIVPVAEP